MPRTRMAKQVKLIEPETNHIDGIQPAHIEIGKLADSPMELAINSLINLKYGPYPKTPIQEIGFFPLRAAVAHAVKLKYKANILITINGKKPPTLPRKQIEAEGLVLKTLLEIIEHMHSINDCGYRNIAEWWFECVCDFHWLHIDAPAPSEPFDYKRSIQRFQRHTGKLINRTQPFETDSERLRFHHTRVLFDAATAEAQDWTLKNEDLHGFYARSYLPHVKARSALTQLMRNLGKKKAHKWDKYTLNIFEYKPQQSIKYTP